MGYICGMRERVHQPYRDALIRTSGAMVGSVGDRTDMFAGNNNGRNDGDTNLKYGATLPNDRALVILAVRVLLLFRAPVARSAATITTSLAGQNGDYFIVAANDADAVTLFNGSSPGDYNDVWRLQYQASEQLFWTLGTGDKPSLISMPSSYFPWGGGPYGDVGGQTDLVFFNNGTPDHTGILRLGRCICLAPRQNIQCSAQIVSLPVGGNGALLGLTQASRNMFDLTDNLNAADLVQKVIAICVDGLLSREVN